MSVIPRLSAVVILASFLATVLYGLLESNLAPAQAEDGAEFVGTVLSVDMSSGKFAVKKDDHVAVRYQRQGSQYVALNVTLTK